MDACVHYSCERTRIYYTYIMYALHGQAAARARDLTSVDVRIDQISRYRDDEKKKKKNKKKKGTALASHLKEWTMNIQKRNEKIFRIRCKIL